MGAHRAGKPASLPRAGVLNRAYSLYSVGALFAGVEDHNLTVLSASRRMSPLDLRMVAVVGRQIDFEVKDEGNADAA